MKKIYSNFLGGLSVSDKITQENAYSQGENLDPHRSPGYIRPGWAHRDQTKGGTLVGLILDAGFNPDDISSVYAISATKLYKLTSFGTAFTSDGNWPHTISNGSEIFFYYIGSNRRLFYICSTDIGMCVPASPTFDNDWGSSIPAGAGALQSAPHPKIEWNTYMFIGNGRYVARLDGQTGANGTIDLTKLDLGKSWEVTSIFPTKNYIGICAWRKTSGGSSYFTDCRIFFWDGTSTTYSYSIPIEDNKITSSINDNGIVYILTTGRGFGNSLRALTNEGSQLVKSLELEINGTRRFFYASYPNIMGLFQNRLLLGVSDSSYGSSIFAYGSTSPEFQKVLLQHMHSSDCYGNINTKVGFIKQLFLGSIYASFYDGTDYYWQRYAGSNSTNAKLKLPYFDLGQGIRINYIKFYFKALASGDDITPTLELDYGTSFGLKDRNGGDDIKYSADGAITSKRFEVKKDCHSFRPVIDWAGGGVSISKIIVDYKFISDN